MIRSLLATLCLALACPAQAPSSDVSVGVFPFLVGNMDSRATEIATNCQVHGMDTVYVSAFRAGGSGTGTLWITDSAGNWNASWGSVRPGGAGIDLAALIAACHAVSVRVVPVLKCFDGSVQPNDLGHRQYLLDVIGYLVDSFHPNGEPVYDIDGIALDYVRYVGSSGASPTHVTNFVADVKDRIGSLSLHAYLLANRYTFDGPTYNSQFNSYSYCIGSLASQYGQHWEQLAAYVDVMMPMSYTANGSIYNTYAEHQAYVARTASYARTACQNAGFPNTRVVPTIRTYSDSNETATTQTIDASATGALLGGGDGYQSFRYQLLVASPSWWGPMAAHAVPGCNWPTPVASGSAQHLTGSVDAAASHDVEQPGSTLHLRVDLDSDGVFESGWGPNAVAQTLYRHPGFWDATIQVRDYTGHVSTTRRRISTTPTVQVNPFFLYVSSGGTANVNLDVGPAGAGHAYLALASLSGMSPGFTWMPGFPVPLNIDFLTEALLGDPNGTFFSNCLGFFDAAGHATATVTLPPGVATQFAWSQVHWSFVSLDWGSGPTCAGGSGLLVLWP